MIAGTAVPIRGTSLRGRLWIMFAEDPFANIRRTLFAVIRTSRTRPGRMRAHSVYARILRTFILIITHAQVLGRIANRAIPAIGVTAALITGIVAKCRRASRTFAARRRITNLSPRTEIILRGMQAGIRSITEISRTGNIVIRTVCSRVFGRVLAVRVHSGTLIHRALFAIVCAGNSRIFERVGANSVHENLVGALMTVIGTVALPGPRDTGIFSHTKIRGVRVRTKALSVG